MSTNQSIIKIKVKRFAMSRVPRNIVSFHIVPSLRTFLPHVVRVLCLFRVTRMRTQAIGSNSKVVRR